MASSRRQYSAAIAARARELLERARPLAESSGIPSHLIVRVLGVQLSAADRPLDALPVARKAENLLSDAPRVCEPCSMTFRIEATWVFARAGDLSWAGRHLAEAEPITGLWQGGPWNASVWEAHAELRLAERENAQAMALFREAADSFAQLRPPLDEARCQRAGAAPTVTVAHDDLTGISRQPTSRSSPKTIELHRSSAREMADHPSVEPRPLLS